MTEKKMVSQEALGRCGENADIKEILRDLADSECDEIIDYVYFLRNQYILEHPFALPRLDQK